MISLPISDYNPKIVSNIASKTVLGMTGGKPKKTNQDSFFVIQNFNKTNTQVLLGVMDGHGINGSQVSNYAKLAIPHHVQSYLNRECKT